MRIIINVNKKWEKDVDLIVESLKNSYSNEFDKVRVGRPVNHAEIGVQAVCNHRVTNGRHKGTPYCRAYKGICKCK